MVHGSSVDGGLGFRLNYFYKYRARNIKAKTIEEKTVHPHAAMRLRADMPGSIYDIVVDVVACYHMLACSVAGICYSIIWPACAGMC